MGEIKTENTDILLAEAERTSKAMKEMEEERTRLMQRLDMLTADILRSQGALAAIQSIVEENGDEA